MMKNLCRVGFLGFFAWAAGCLCLTNDVWAQGLEISPIQILFAPGQMTTTLAVTNKDADKVGLQLRSYLWDQSNGTDNLTATTDLAVSPPITEVEGGQTQTFRLVLRHAATDKEASYRLLLDQLPTANSAGSVLIVLRLSVPVFVKPATHIDTNIAWQIVASSDGSSLMAINHGGAHLRVVNSVLTQPDGQRLDVAVIQSPYVLPGAERRWPIKGNKLLRLGATYHLSAMSDGGPIDAVVHVAAP